MNNIKKPNVTIVNENDEIIGYKQRGSILSEDIYRVSGIVIKNSKNQFLLAQRSFNKINNPGQWSLSAAGTIEEGENYDENIIHELEEEIGLKNIKIEKLEKQRRYGKHNFFTQLYKAELDKDINDFVIQKEEVEKLRWFTKEEILKGGFEGNSISKTLIDNLDLFF